jgi:hypothetical protein
MKPNINPYNQTEFQIKFIQSNIYKQLVLDFDQIIFEKYFTSIPNITPRELWGSRTTLITAVPFYYLEYLLGKHPLTIYDLGCGWNVFKKYIPSIIGVGAEPPTSEQYFGNQHDYVDDDFIKGHQNFFDCVFSINALHFVPLSRLQQRVLEFNSMIKSNGSGFLALNLARMLERDVQKFNNFSPLELDQYVRDQLYDLDINYKVFDVEFTSDNLDEYMDGNIRLVIEK